ncbi:MAG: cyclase, partial [Opitutaceae bacterium]|nr:cyclase [Opitutaceae bacterium]
MRAVTIRKPASELYAFWRNIENLQSVIKDP